MFAYIHFQKYNRYGFWEAIYTTKYRGLEPRQIICIIGLRRLKLKLCAI